MRGIVPTNASKIERMFAVDVWTNLLCSSTLLHEDNQDREAEMLLSSVRCRKAGQVSRLRLRVALRCEDWGDFSKTRRIHEGKDDMLHG